MSSTFYDLKYIRNNVERFIYSYGFEPVLFESGSITFEHEKKLDESCYNEVKTCHMMVLIVGGRYGSKASNESDGKKLIDNYEQYISITRKEFITAKEKNLPIFIFIDKNVHTEYETYKKNKELFRELLQNNEEPKFSFAHVDSIYVFEFINEIRKFGLPIYMFENFEDIEIQLKSQLAGMFYLYLKDLQNIKGEAEVITTIDELKSLTAQMNQMIQKVGEKILTKESSEYDEVIFNQNKLVLKYAAEKIALKFKMYGGTIENKHWIAVADFITKEYLMSDDLAIAQEYDAIYDDSRLKTFYVNIFTELGDLLTNVKKNSITLEKINYDDIENIFFSDVIDIIKDNEEYQKIFSEYLAKYLSKSCIPF